MASFSPITTHIMPGMDSQDVKTLQQFLNAMGYSVASSGPGSPGQESTYFGPGTLAALQKFQADHGIVTAGDPGTTGYGAVGPNTMAQINTYIANPNTIKPTASPTPASSDRIDPNSIYNQYGFNPNQAAVNKATTALDGFLNLLHSGAAGNTGISDTEMNRIINDPSQVGFYLNALAYGGYTLQDVYKDMVWQQDQNSGQGNMAGVPEPISGNVESHLYKASPAYAQVSANTTLGSISPTIAGLDSSVTSVPLLQMPDNAFNDVKPLTMDQVRQQMQGYKDATYDIALKMATATNDAQHTQAMSDWNNLKGQLESRLGINLSDNAIQAWNQVSNFAEQAVQRGIAGSGMGDKQIDDYLREQMSVNQSVRKYFSNYEDLSKANYYQNYASPQEINQLIATDPEKAQSYGLIPNDQAKQALSLDALRAQFPGTPDDQLQAILNKYVDSNGNYYSKLYGNYAQSNYATNQNYQSWQAQQVLSNSTNQAAQSQLQYSNPNDPFLKPNGSGVQPTIPGYASSTDVYNASPSQSTTPATTYAAPSVPTLPANTTSGNTPSPTLPANTTPTPKAPTQTPVKPSTFSALSNLNGSSPSSVGSSAASNPTFSTAAFSLPDTTPKPPPVQPATPNGLTSGGSTGLGSVFQSAASGVGNFFKKLF